MLSLIGLLSNSVTFYKKIICSKIVLELRKRGLPGIGFALCSTLVTLPAFAASAGNEQSYYSAGTSIPIFRLSIMLIEVIVLGINSQLIMSDMKLIRWYEKKKRKKRRV